MDRVRITKYMGEEILHYTAPHQLRGENDFPYYSWNGFIFSSLKKAKDAVRKQTRPAVSVSGLLVTPPFGRENRMERELK